MKKNTNISTSNKGRGLYIIILPILALIFILFLRVLLSLFQVYSNVDLTTVSAELTLINIGAATLNFLALICVIAFIVCTPIGIHIVLKKEKISNIAYDKRSGKGSASEIPDEIRGWSWGAAGLGIIWGITFNVWISFFAFIPIVNFFWWIVMGIKGREWAWQNNKWASVDEFNKSQKKWNIIGLIFFILGILSLMGSLGNLGNSQNSVNNNIVQQMPSSKVFTSSDGLVTLSANTDWTETTGLNNDASLQLKNKSGVYAILINEKKSDFALDLQGYANLVINNFKSSKTAAQLINGPLQTTINGNNAVQYEYTFTYNGINYVIQFTIVESQSHFHQIEIYGANSYFEANLPVFNLLLQGFSFQ
jgi:hypothetical protein